MVRQNWEQLPFFDARQPGSNWIDWVTLKYFKKMKWMFWIKQENPTLQQSPLHIGLYSRVGSRGNSALPCILTSCGQCVLIILILVFFERKAGCTGRRAPQHALSSPHFWRFVFTSSSIHKQMKTRKMHCLIYLCICLPHVSYRFTVYSHCISFRSVKISVWVERII